MVICLEQGADDLYMVQLMPLPPPSSLASLKSRFDLHFSSRLTQVVLGKRLLDNVCLSMLCLSYP